MTLRANALPRPAGLRVAGIAALAAAALLAGLLAAPAQSEAVTFGANLGSREPDNPTPCNGPFFFFQTFQTCSANSQNLSTGETAFPPAGRGVITKVRVKVGPVTGPMQIVVEQALRADNPGDPGHPTYACCQAVAASHVFTPAAGTTSEQNVRLPVRQDIAPDPNTGYYVDQHLSLSVLAPNVPIPASADPNGVYGIWFPAWQVGDERAGPPYSGGGATVLFNADWTSCGTAAGASASALAHPAKKKGKKKKKKKPTSPCGTTAKKKKKKGKKKRK